MKTCVSADAKDDLRDCGGLKQIAALLTSRQPETVKEVAMYCLGCVIGSNG